MMRTRNFFAASVLATALSLGCGSESVAPNGNGVPRIISLTAQPGAVIRGGQVQVTVIASDPDSDPLTYVWSSPGGSFGDSTLANTTWTAPTVAGSYVLTILVSDGNETVSGSELITVGSASLTVSSDPPGAFITLDGLGTAFQTPHTFDPLPAGAHSARLFSPDYAYTPVSHLTQLADAQAETLHFDTRVTQVTTLDLGRGDVLEVTGVAYLPAGNGLVYAAETGNGTGIFGLSLFGSADDGLQLVSDVRVSEPVSVSADGSLLFYVAADGTLYTVSIDDTNDDGVVDLVGVPDPLDDFRFAPSLSTDDRVAFSLTSSDQVASNPIFWALYVNGALDELNLGSTTVGKLPTWKPGDTALAYVWNGSIYRSDAVIPGSVAVVDTLYNTAPAWGPWGSTHIAYVSGPNAGALTSLKLAVVGNNNQATVFEGLEDPRHISWNPVTRELVVSHNPSGGSEILLFDALPIP